jgi:SRSO17 transposase
VLGWPGDLLALVAGRFLRVEPRLQARAYLRGLLVLLASKNGWTLAEAAGNKTPDKMQRLLNRAGWDADGVRDDVRGYVARHLGDAGGVLIVDEPGFVKKGTRSAGVLRQYSGTAGRVENCQLGVFLAYAAPRGRALVDRELYLPKSWTEDRERCREAGVPGDVPFATKPELARLMLGRALDAGVPAAWVTADEAYGKDGKFRDWLEQRRIGNIVAVAANQAVRGDAGTSRADVLAAHAPRSGLEAAQLRERLQRAPGVRLGGRHLARRRRAARLVPVPAGTALAHPERQGRAGTGLLPVLRPGRDC